MHKTKYKSIWFNKRFRILENRSQIDRRNIKFKEAFANKNRIQI